MNHKAFTLVELIIVITILAILSTMWFLSIQKYAEQSRISSKTADFNNLYRYIWIELSKGWNIHDYIDHRDHSSLSTTSGWTLQISWFNPAQNPWIISSYKAGIINYANLNISSDTWFDKDYQNNFRIGASTYLWEARFQLAATIVRGWIEDTIIRWNYVPRYTSIPPTSQTDYTKNPYIVSRAINASMTQWDTLIILNNQKYIDLWWKVGDQLRIWPVAPVWQELIIERFLSDTQIVVHTPITYTTGTRDVYINQNESLHLISRRSSSSAPIEIWRTDGCCVPYNFAHPSLN